MSAASSSTRVCIGQFAGAHGVRGLARLKPFTAVADDVVRYGPVETEDAARRFTLERVGRAKGVLIVRVEGVGDRDAASALTGTRLYVARDRLPAPADGEFYFADLIGLSVTAPDGAPLGAIRAVQDFGAGTLLELTLADGSAVLVPFTEAVVPAIDLARRSAVIALPTGLLDPAHPDDAAAQDEDAA